MKIIKGVFTYTMLLIGAALIICMALVGCMFLFPNFKVFGWGIMFKSNELASEVRSPELTAGATYTLDIDAKLHDVYIYQYSDSTPTISLQKFDDMFGIMKGSRDSYDGSVKFDPVDATTYKVEAKDIEGAILKRSSKIVVYVPNGRSYKFNIKTTSGNINIDGSLREVAGKVKSATELNVKGLNLETTTGSFSWSNVNRPSNVVELENLSAKTQYGKFNFSLGDDVTIKGNENSKYYLECKRGEFTFNNVKVNEMHIEGNDVLVVANELNTVKSFYFNAPNGFFNVTKLVTADKGLSTIITNNIDVQLNEVIGELAITTTYGNINVNKTTKNASLKSINGNITVGKAEDNLSAISEHGDIIVGSYNSKVYLKNKHGKIEATYNKDAFDIYSSIANKSEIINEEGSITVNDLMIGTDLTTTSGGTINASYYLMPKNDDNIHNVKLLAGGTANLQVANTNGFMFNGKGNISGKVSSVNMTATTEATQILSGEGPFTTLNVDAGTGNAVFSTYNK